MLDSNVSQNVKKIVIRRNIILGDITWMEGEEWFEMVV